MEDARGANAESPTANYGKICLTTWIPHRGYSSSSEFALRTTTLKQLLELMFEQSTAIIF
jgi:hypothetical protein